MTVPTKSRIARYLSVILRWIFITAGVFAFTVLIGLHITNEILPKVYTASALLELPANDLVTPSPGANPEPVAPEPEVENTMMSPDFLLAVIKDLDLDKEWAKRVYRTDADQLPDGDALTRMGKLVKIEITHGTNLVKITATSDVPQEAADIANAMADRYKDLRLAESRQGTTLSLSDGPVRIVSRAEIPLEPTQPDKGFNFIVTLVVAGFLSITAASFVEIIFLFLRAGERAGN